MGNFFTTFRIIYIQQEGNLYPLTWPETLEELKEHLQTEFNCDKNVLKFDDATSSEQKVCVSSEKHYKSLIPKYKSISDKIDVYYVGLDI
jgi:hypothetical protein